MVQQEFSFQCEKWINCKTLLIFKCFASCSISALLRQFFFNPFQFLQSRKYSVECRENSHAQELESIHGFIFLHYLFPTLCKHLQRYRVLWGWKLTEPKHVPVCLLTNTFERLLAGRWSVFWPSYLCFAHKLVNEVRCRLHLSFNVLAWFSPILAEECSGACQPGLIFFLHQVKCAACVGIRGATTVFF